MPSYRVLLTDGAMRRTLAAARALAATGHRVTVGEDSRFNTTFFSRHCHQRLLYPSPRQQPEAFIDFLVDHLNRNPYDCLLPMESDTLDLILCHRARVESLTRLPFVPLERYLLFRDKRRSTQLADQLGIPQPATAFPTSPQRVVEACRPLGGYPLIIKPRHGWGSRGITVVRSDQELRDAYLTLHREDPLPIVQRFVTPGPKFYTCAIMDETHELLGVTAHRELRNHPAPLGPSTAQRTEALPQLIDYTSRLLKAARWVGVANADFMLDGDTGEPLFMEINPRFWGPLQASIQAGVNFPDLLVRWAMGERVAPVLDYSLGKVTRAFLPYELLHFASSPDRFRMEPSFFEFWGEDVGYDILSRRDPGTVLGFAATVARYLFEPEVWIRQARLEKVGRWLARRQGKALSDVSKVSIHFSANGQSHDGVLE